MAKVNNFLVTWLMCFGWLNKAAILKHDFLFTTHVTVRLRKCVQKQPCEASWSTTEQSETLLIRVPHILRFVCFPSKHNKLQPTDIFPFASPFFKLFYRHISTLFIFLSLPLGFLSQSFHFLTHTLSMHLWDLHVVWLVGVILQSCFVTCSPQLGKSSLSDGITHVNTHFCIQLSPAPCTWWFEFVPSCCRLTHTHIYWLNTWQRLYPQHYCQCENTSDHQHDFLCAILIPFEYVDSRSVNKINDNLRFKCSLRQTEISHLVNTWSRDLYLQCVCTATVAADDETTSTHTNTLPCTHAEVHSACRHTLNAHTHTHTQTHSITTYMFPLLSSLILEFITEKAHPCFLLFSPDVSSSSLPVHCFSPLSWPLLFIVMWSEELTVFFFRTVYMCAFVWPQQLQT